MDSVHCSDACPAAGGVVSVAASPAAPPASVTSQLYVDQFGGCSLPAQHCLSVSQCAPVDPPHFQLHLPRPPPAPQVHAPLIGGHNYPQHSGGSAPGLGMLYNPAVSSLVKREPRTRDVGSGVMGGWHTMSPVGYRDRRLVQSVTPVRNSSTPVPPVSNQLPHQHELSTRNITNNNHDSTADRKKSRRSGNH